MTERFHDRPGGRFEAVGAAVLVLDVLGFAGVTEPAGFDAYQLVLGQAYGVVVLVGGAMLGYGMGVRSEADESTPNEPAGESGSA